MGVMKIVALLAIFVLPPPAFAARGGVGCPAVGAGSLSREQTHDVQSALISAVLQKEDAKATGGQAAALNTATGSFLQQCLGGIDKLKELYAALQGLGSTNFAALVQKLAGSAARELVAQVCSYTQQMSENLVNAVLQGQPATLSAPSVRTFTPSTVNTSASDVASLLGKLTYGGKVYARP